MKKRSKQSIYLTLSLIIILTVTVTMSIHASYSYFTTKQNLIEQMKIDSNNTVQALQKNIEKLIEAYAVNEYENLLRHELERRNIFAIVVKDYNMGKIMGKEAYVTGYIKQDNNITLLYDAQNSEHQALLEKSYWVNEYIIYNKSRKELGQLSVYVSDKHMQMVLSSIVQQTLINTVAISFFLVLALFITIRSFIFMPMGEIIERLQEQDKDGIPLKKIKTTSFVEVDWLVDAINNMIEAIRQSRHSMNELNERLELAWEGVNDGIWDWQIQKDEAYFSQRWKSMLGYEEHEVQNRPEAFFDLIHEEDKKKVQMVLDAHFKDPMHNPYYLEARLLCKDGSYKWILLRGKASFDKKGQPIRMVGSHTDIDQTKKITELINKAEIKFHTLFQESLDAIVLLDLETQQFIEFNHKTLLQYGYTEEEFKKLSPQDLCAEFTNIEDMKAKQQEIVRKGWDHFLTQHKTKEGKVLDIAVKSKCIHLNNKEVLYITLHDITKEKENELILARSLELQTRIFDHVGYILIRTDENGVIQQINKEAEKVLGYSAQELIGKYTPEILHLENEVVSRTTDFSKTLKYPIKPGFETFVIKSNLDLENEHEWTYVTKKGVKIPVILKVSALKDKAGHIYGYLGIAQDLTQRKLMESQSKLASMGEMIGNIAHQWRQPLSVISTIASGVKVKSEFGQFSIEEVIPDMDNIVGQTQYLSKTIDDFRDFIKNSNKKEPFSIVNSIEKTLNILHSSMVNNSIEVVLDLEDDMKIDGFKNQLIQALINIINNAKDALKENVQKDEDRFIFISTHHKENALELSIKDSGGGISEEIMGKIFEPYFTTKHQSVGTGIGLSMAHQILTQHHNARITVHNENFNYKDKNYTGACFQIYFLASKA